MQIEYDEAKDESNRAKHGLSLGDADDFDFETALIIEDRRKNYGEERYRALGYIGERIHALVFALRGEVIRVISLRKANSREVKYYASNTEGEADTQDNGGT